MLMGLRGFDESTLGFITGPTTRSLTGDSSSGVSKGSPPTGAVSLGTTPSPPALLSQSPGTGSSTTGGSDGLTVPVQSLKGTTP